MTHPPFLIQRPFPPPLQDYLEFLANNGLIKESGTGCHANATISGKNALNYINASFKFYHFSLCQTLPSLSVSLTSFLSFYLSYFLSLKVYFHESFARYIFRCHETALSRSSVWRMRKKIVSFFHFNPIHIATPPSFSFPPFPNLSSKDCCRTD